MVGFMTGEGKLLPSTHNITVAFRLVARPFLQRSLPPLPRGPLAPKGSRDRGGCGQVQSQTSAPRTIFEDVLWQTLQDGRELWGGCLDGC